MLLDTQYPQLIKVLEEKKSFVICLPPTASTDAQAGACALYLALLKAGKQASITCGAPLTKEVDLVAIEKVTTDLQAEGGNTLTMSFPYQEGAVDKVSYDIEGDRFKLVIQPKEGHPKLDSKNVEFGYTGGKIDVIVTIEALSLESLGKLYTDNQPKFSGVDVINIDRRFNNAQFGTINVVEKQVSSISEIIHSILSYLKIENDKDIATNLYAGIVFATNNFSSYSVNADTFDVASRLLRAGAVKKPFTKKTDVSPLGQNSAQSAPVVQPQPVAQPVDVPQPTTSQPPQPVNQPQPIDQPKQTPSDWLKPKIFKSSSNLA